MYLSFPSAPICKVMPCLGLTWESASVQYIFFTPSAFPSLENLTGKKAHTTLARSLGTLMSHCSWAHKEPKI